MAAADESCESTAARDRRHYAGGVRDEFPEFYVPGPDDERHFITAGTVVVDANVLLALYELSAVQRNETLAALEKIRERLWIPYQVGLEYQRNRLGTVRKQAANYTNLVGLHGARDLEKLKSELAAIRVPDEIVDEVRPLLDDLARQLSDATRAYVSATEKIRGRHVVTAEQGISDDPVRRRLDDLFAGRVGKKPDEGVRRKRITEATQRRKDQIPPGYKDDKKESDERNAGDYLLWSELLDYAESVADTGRPFLLVTNDVKEDWYEKSGGEPIGPRPELRREFHSRNPNGYHQVTLDGLLRLAKVHLLAEVDDATIEKVSELSRVDIVSPNDAGVRRLGDDARGMSNSGYENIRWHTRSRPRLLDELMDIIIRSTSMGLTSLGRRELRHSLVQSARDLANDMSDEEWPPADLRDSAEWMLRKTLESKLPDDSLFGLVITSYEIELFTEVVHSFWLSPPLPEGDD